MENRFRFTEKWHRQYGAFPPAPCPASPIRGIFHGHGALAAAKAPVVPRCCERTPRWAQMRVVFAQCLFSAPRTRRHISSSRLLRPLWAGAVSQAILIYDALASLRTTGRAFRRTFFSWDSPDVCLRIALELWVWGRRTTEGRCCSEHTVWRAPLLSGVAWWSWCPSGFSSAKWRHLPISGSPHRKDVIVHSSLERRGASTPSPLGQSVCRSFVMLCEEFCLFSPFTTYLFNNYLFGSESMDVYFILWITSPLATLFCSSNRSGVGHWGCL